MYSKNDYRYYLERKLDSDYLAHERSHKYIKKIGDRYFYTQQELAAFLNKDNPKKVTLEKRVDPTTGTKDYRIDFNKHEHWSDGVGVRITPKSKYGPKSISVYDTTKTKWDSKNDDYVYEKKTKGRVTKERAEDGVSYTVDLSKKRRMSKKTKDAILDAGARGADLTSSVARKSRPKSYFIAENSIYDAQKKGKKLTAKTKAQPTIKADQERGRSRTKQLSGKSPEYITELESNSRRNKLVKKKTLKQKASSLRRKYGLYREKPKGKSIGGGIRVTHNTVIK